MDMNVHETFFNRSQVAMAYGSFLIPDDPEGRADMRFLEVNPAFVAFAGAAGSQAVGRTFSELFPPDARTDAGVWEAALRNAAAGKGPQRARYRDGGSDRWIRIRITAIDASTGAFEFESDTSISDLMIHEQERAIDAFLRTNLDMLCVADLKGNFIKVNTRFEEVLGYETRELEGQSFRDLIHPDDLAATDAAVAGLAEGKPIKGFVNRYRCRNGSYKYIEWNANTFEGESIYASARDVTAAKMTEEQLRSVAIRDELTGLYNRYFFDSIINEEMARSDRYDAPLSIALIDLDLFKNVNDTYGHQVGDGLLRQVAQVTCATIRTADIMVRYGGEEFLVLMTQTAIGGATVAAEKIRRSLESVEHPVAGRQTVSVGVAERMKGESFRHWFRRVDEALYRAKENGRNAVYPADEAENLSLTTMRLAWKSEWESGDERIDEEHRELIEIADSLVFQLMVSTGRRDIMKQVERLLVRTREHFEHEEKIMAENGYPGQADHAHIHHRLIEKASKMKDAYHKRQIRATAFFSFIVDDIILGHLVEEDMKYFSYLTGEG